MIKTKPKFINPGGGDFYSEIGNKTQFLGTFYNIDIYKREGNYYAVFGDKLNEYYSSINELIDLIACDYATMRVEDEEILNAQTALAWGKLPKYLYAALLAIALSEILPKIDRKSTRLNSSHIPLSRMPSSA